MGSVCVANFSGVNDPRNIGPVASGVKVNNSKHNALTLSTGHRGKTSGLKAGRGFVAVVVW